MGGRHVGSCVCCRCLRLHVATLVPLPSRDSIPSPLWRLSFRPLDRHWYRSGEGSVTPSFQPSREWTCSFSASGSSPECSLVCPIVSLTRYTLTIWWRQRSVSTTCKLLWMQSLLGGIVGGSPFGIGLTKSAVMVFGPRRGVPPCSVFLSGQELPFQQTWVARSAQNPRAGLASLQFSSDGELLISPQTMGLDVLPGVGGRGLFLPSQSPMTELASIVFAHSFHPFPHMDAISADAGQHRFRGWEGHSCCWKLHQKMISCWRPIRRPRIRLQQSEHPGTREHPEELHWVHNPHWGIPRSIQDREITNRVEAADCLT